MNSNWKVDRRLKKYIEQIPSFSPIMFLSKKKKKKKKKSDLQLPSYLRFHEIQFLTFGTFPAI